MRLPRDLTGAALIKALGRIGYRSARQSGSHVRLTLEVEGQAQHHVTVPLHDPLRAARCRPCSMLLQRIAAAREMR